MNLLRSAKVDKKTLKSTARKALMFPQFTFESSFANRNFLPGGKVLRDLPWTVDWTRLISILFLAEVSADFRITGKL